MAFGNPSVAPEYDLPGSEMEVKALAELFPSAKIYLNADASKTQFKLSAAADARLLHVAAHAQADQTDPMYSRILLANEGGKQNFLEAHEVLGLELDDVAGSRHANPALAASPMVKRCWASHGPSLPPVRRR